MKKILEKAEQLFSKEQRPDGTISNRFRFFLALPIMPLNLSNVLIHNAFIKYYTDIIGLEARFVGLIYLIFGIWNAINDPLMGLFIDKFKYNPKRGKYAYLMKVTAPVIIFSSFCMLFASPGWNEWLIFAFFTFMLFIYDTAQTTYSIAFLSYKLIAAPTREERIDVNVLNTYISNIGGFLGTIIPTLLLVGDTKPLLTQLLFSAMILINSGLYYIGLRYLKDKPEMYAHDEENSEAAQLASFLTKSVKDAFKSRSFLSFVFYQFIGNGPKAFYFTAFLYMMDYVLKLNGLQATVADVLPGIVMFFCLPAIGKIVKIWGVKKTVIWGSIPSALSFALLFVVQDFFQVTLVYCFIIIFSNLTGMAQPPILGAIIDEDEMKTGVRKAGLFSGLNALLTIPVGGVQAVIFTSVISAFTFVSGTKVQSEEAILGIRIASSLIPAAFILLGIIPMLFFPIDKKREQVLSDFAESAHRGHEQSE